MKPIIYDQWLTTFCQTYSVFAALWILTGKYVSQKNVERFIKEQNLKGGNAQQKWGLSSKEVCKILGLKVKQVFWMDEEFMKLWKEWRPLIIGMRVNSSFYQDSKDWLLEFYNHLRGKNEDGHDVVICFNTKEKQGYLINSGWILTPPCKIDIEKFDKNWLKLPTAFTISL